jgi:leader peptidase (prepilin peptidase)/N-methyltransferase
VSAVPALLPVLLPVLAGLLGLAAGVPLARSAQRWEPTSEPALVPAGGPLPDGGPAARSVAVRVPRPVPELATGVLFALATVRFGASWDLPAFLVLAAAGVWLTVVDLRTRRLPDRVVLPALGSGVVLLAGAALAGHDLPALGRAAAGAALAFAGFLVLALLAPAGLGMGDVKLAALLGLLLGWLGWPAVWWGAVAGFVVQALVSVVLLAARRVDRRGELPFGPAMLAGAAVTVGLANVLLGGALFL